MASRRTPASWIPKGPVAGMPSGFGVAAARVLGRDDVLAVRVEFFVLTAVSALGVYLLVLHLWDSVVAALVAVAVFASFRSYAYFAAAGPDGHTPGAGVPGVRPLVGRASPLVLVWRSRLRWRSAPGSRCSGFPCWWRCARWSGSTGTPAGGTGPQRRRQLSARSSRCSPTTGRAGTRASSSRACSSSRWGRREPPADRVGDRAVLHRHQHLVQLPAPRRSCWSWGRRSSSSRRSGRC